MHLIDNVLAEQRDEGIEQTPSPLPQSPLKVLAAPHQHWGRTRRASRYPPT